MDGHVARVEGVLSKFQQVNLSGKRPLGKPRPRWEDNIRMELK